MESKQTATEWLYEQLTSIWFDKTSGQHILEQAKVMHKQEIINAYRDGRSDQQSEKPSRFYNRWAELYYNETYGGNK
jgi:hypothetical protein